MCRETPPGHVFVESFAEIHPRNVAQVVFAYPDIRYPDIRIYPLILWQPKIRIS